jgi:hypothetical protein
MKNTKVLITGVTSRSGTQRVVVSREEHDIYYLDIRVPYTWPVQTAQVASWPRKSSQPNLPLLPCIGLITGSISARLFPSGIVASMPLVREIGCLGRPDVQEDIRQRALKRPSVEDSIR